MGVDVQIPGGRKLAKGTIKNNEIDNNMLYCGGPFGSTVIQIYVSPSPFSSVMATHSIAPLREPCGTVVKLLYCSQNCAHELGFSPS